MEDKGRAEELPQIQGDEGNMASNAIDGPRAGPITEYENATKDITGAIDKIGMWLKSTKL